MRRACGRVSLEPRDQDHGFGEGSHLALGILSLPLECWEYEPASMPSWRFHGFWGSSIWSSFLHSKYFTYRRISSAPPPCFLVQGLSLNLKLTYFPKLTGQQTPGSSCLLLFLPDTGIPGNFSVQVPGIRTLRSLCLSHSQLLTPPHPGAAFTCDIKDSYTT